MSGGATGYFLRLRARDSEIDKQGFVYHAHYVTYFDVALTAFLRGIGHDYASQVRSGTDFHVVKVVVEYKRPIRFDEEFDLHVGIGRIGNTSITFKVEVRSPSEDHAIALGEVVWVHADQQAHRPTALPPGLVRLLEKSSSVQ